MAQPEAKHAEKNELAQGWQEVDSELQKQQHAETEEVMDEIWQDFHSELLKLQQQQQGDEKRCQSPRKRLRPERLLLGSNCEHPEAKRLCKSYAEFCGVCDEELSPVFGFEDHGQATKFTEHADEVELRRQTREQRELLKAMQAAELRRVIDGIDGDDSSLTDSSSSTSAEQDVLNLWAAMKPHQKEGMDFLVGLLKDGHGGVLAHDMGLGKTMTAIASLVKLSEETSESLRCVVVAPKNPLFHWQEEFSKWLPSGRVKVVWLASEKNPLKRAELLVKWCKAQDKPKQLLIVVVSYDVLTNVLLESERMQSQGMQKPDITKLQEWLRNVPNLVIADEGHKLNHKNTRWYEALCQFQTTRRVVLSGNPFSNHLGEYYNLLKWVQPAMVLKTEKEFAEKYMFFGTSALLSSTQIGSTWSVASVERLRRDTERFVHRRDRTDPNLKPPLPAKLETVLLCQPTVEQQRRQQLVLRAEGDLMQKRTRMERISMHPGLAQSLAVDEEQPVLVKSKQAEHVPELSSKVMVFLKLLEWCHLKQEKVVAFSEHVYFMNSVEPLLKNVYGNLVFRMDGRTSVKTRKEVACAFNSTKGFAVFLLSTRACSEGIDLQTARRVAILDPTWNPGWKSQAVARCWRIGQEKTVFVYHFLTATSHGESPQHADISKEQRSLLEFEKVIFQRGLRKEHLFSQAVDARCGAHMDEQASVNEDPFLDELQAEATLSNMVTAITPQQFWATYRAAEDLEQALLPTEEPESPSTPNNWQTINMPAAAPPELVAFSPTGSLPQEQLVLGNDLAGAASPEQNVSPSPVGTPSQQEQTGRRLDGSDASNITELVSVFEPKPVLAPELETQTTQDAPCTAQAKHECLWQGAWWDVQVVRRRQNTVVVKYINFPGCAEDRVAKEAVRKASLKPERPTDLVVGQRVCCFVHMRRHQETGINGKAWYDGVLLEHKTVCNPCRRVQNWGSQFNYDRCKCLLLVDCWVHGEHKRKNFLVRLQQITAVRE